MEDKTPSNLTDNGIPANSLRNASQLYLNNLLKRGIGSYYLKPTSNDIYLVYLEDSRVRFLCPWCGRAHTSPVARQLHLLLYSRVDASCNGTSKSMVSCNVCKYSTIGNIFDLHPCTLIFINKLDEMLLTREVSIDAVDYCILCGTLHGCKYGLFSHLLVYHFPNAVQNQCGYCGKRNVLLKEHEKTHKQKIRTISNNILTIFLEESRKFLSKHKNFNQLMKLFYQFFKCLNLSYKKDDPIDVFLHFIYPYSCILCGTFKGNHEDLQRHILFDDHPQLTDRNLYAFQLENGKVVCRYCTSTTFEPERKPCNEYYESIKMRLHDIPKFHFSAHRTCLLCWNRNLRVHQLMVHIPVRHNLGNPSVCGLCHEEAEPYHERKHESELINRIGFRQVTSATTEQESSQLSSLNESKH